MQASSREQIEAAHELAEALLRFLKALRPSEPKPTEPPRAPRPESASAWRPEPPPPRRIEPPPAKDVPPGKLLLSTRDAAAFLSVSGRTLWTLTAPRGPIPSVRLGRSVRYSVESLQAWARSAEQKPRERY